MEPDVIQQVCNFHMFKCMLVIRGLHQQLCCHHAWMTSVWISINEEYRPKRPTLPTCCKWQTIIGTVGIIRHGFTWQCHDPVTSAASTKLQTIYTILLYLYAKAQIPRIQADNT